MTRAMPVAWILVIVPLVFGPAGAQESRTPSDGPWFHPLLVVTYHGADESEAPRIQYKGKLSPSPEVRLDDGTVAMLAVTPAPCGRDEQCEPADCGCHGVDRFLLSIASEDGEIARAHVWAAYGTFDIVPLDLVDGPGEELIIERRLGRSAPPTGLELKIVRIAHRQLIDLVDPVQTAGTLSGTPMVCGMWTSRVTVNDAAAKPRSLWLETLVSLRAGCVLDEPGRVAPLTSERRELVLVDGRYQLKKR